MSRQLDQEREQREDLRRQELVKAIEFGIVGALKSQGIDFVGLALRYDDFNSLLTLKADINGIRNVCFVGSDSMMNCFLKAQSEALRQALQWREDKYHQKSD